MHGIKRQKERNEIRKGGRERSKRWESLETEETEESVRACRWLRGRAHLCQRSMARRRITGGKVTEERDTHRRG